MFFFIKFQKWKTDEHKKKSILRRISTKSKNFLLNKKKTLTEEDIEEMRERVEQVKFLSKVFSLPRIAKNTHLPRHRSARDDRPHYMI